MTVLNYLSVCSGIEAASVAWEPLGWKPVGFAEIEAFPSAVLAHHYPDVCNFGDMTRLHDWLDIGIFEAPDILCGGTPCQAFSVAGLRRSLDDARGNLSLIFCDLANAIDTHRERAGKKPSIIFWENVPGVLTTKDNAFGCFLAGLAGEDDPLVPPGGRWSNAGYVSGPKRTVAWRILDAQYFGLAQRRRRVFVVASARNGFDPATVLFEWDGVRRDTAPSREAGKVAPTIPSRSSGGGGLGTDFDCDGGLICMAHGQGGAEVASERRATLTCNHEAPIIAFDTTQITSAANRCNPKSGDPCHPLAAGAHPPAIDFSCKDHGADAGAISPTLRAMNHAGSHANAGGQLAVAYSTKLHNTTSNGAGKFYKEYTAGLDANSPPPAVICVTGDITHTLKAEGSDASEDGTGRGQPLVAFNARQDPDTWFERTGPLDTDGGTQAVKQGFQVRRLMPVECERLQGFPDGYTSIPWRKKPVSECPDGPRYKAIGNAWAVPVIRWLGHRIQAELA
jgi:DNA (cytosine-5)-methyltransferase 1